MNYRADFESVSGCPMHMYFDPTAERILSRMNGQEEPFCHAIF